jgi:anti-anti-sigma factor
MGPGRHRMPPQLLLTKTMIDETAISLTVAGDLELGTVGQFNQTVQTILAEPALTRVVLDFGSLAFIGSSGISALVAALQTAQRQDITLTVVNCPDPVRHILRITGLLDRLGTGGRTHGET